MMIWGIIFASQAEETLGAQMEKMLQNASCTLETDVIFLANTKSVIQQASSPVPDCVHDILSVLSLEELEEPNIIVQIDAESQTVNTTVLPSASLHYYYENPNLSVAQRLHLSVFLGVLHE